MLTPGTVLQNRYQIVRQLGAGGMGAVYLACDLRLGNRLVVVKENQGSDPHQFQIEANLLATLSHPSLPRVGDHFLDASGAQYLVMDYVEGQNLELIAQQHGVLPEGTVLGWIYQVLDAVEYLHANRVVHRDIKPENIIITPLGKAVLVDFGIAKQLMTGRATLSGARAATPGYAAPEQYRGGTDQRSDIYSLGATTYALLTGGAPPDSLARERGTAVLVSPRQVNHAISQNSEDALLIALNLNPAARFSSVALMRQALYARQAALPPSSGTPLAQARGVVRNRLAFAGIAGLVAGCVLLLLLLSFIVSRFGLGGLPAPSAPTSSAAGAPGPSAAVIGTARPVTPGTSLPLPTFTPIPLVSPTRTVAASACAAPPTPTSLTQVASEIPGTRLAVCSHVASLVDAKTKPRDVYAIDLAGGQEARFIGVATGGSLGYALYNPGSTSIETKQLVTAFSESISGKWARDFTPAVSGTYYLAIQAGSTDQKYTLTVSATGNSVAANIADEIPGTKLSLGGSAASVVDGNTKRRNVHAMDLVAGQEVRFSVVPASGSLSYVLYNPGASSIETKQVTLAFSDGSSTRWARDFTPAASGTYYLAIVAGATEQKYTLTVTTTGNNASGNVGDEIPGTRLSVGNSIVSVVDTNLKKRDVHAIDLTAGHEVRFTVVPASGSLSYALYNPSSASIETKQAITAFTDSGSGKWARDFTPAVSGTYYLAILSGASEQKYTLTVTVTGNVTSGNIADEIPGTRLDLGGSIASIVDINLKKMNVHAVELVAGQETRFSLVPVNGSLTFTLYNPSSRLIQTKQVSTAFSDSGSARWVRDFTPAVSGTYYLAIQPSSTEQKYMLTVSTTGNRVPANIADEIPGTKLAAGSSVTSVVDSNTQKRHVYAVDLVIGQEVRFTVIPTNGSMSYFLGNPASRSFEANQVTRVFSENSSSKWVYDYTPNATGTFYFAVTASGSGQTYSLSVVPRR